MYGSTPRGLGYGDRPAAVSRQAIGHLKHLPARPSEPFYAGAGNGPRETRRDARHNPAYRTSKSTPSITKLDFQLLSCKGMGNRALRTIYLDTCIYGDMAEGKIPSSEVDILRKAISSGTVRITTSMTLMDELAHGVSSSSLNSRLSIELASELCTSQGVRMHKEILADEVLAGLRGRKLRSIFMLSGSEDDDHYRWVWNGLRSPNSRFQAELDEWSAEETARLSKFRDHMKLVKEKVEEEGVLTKGSKPGFDEFRSFEYADGVVALGMTENALEQAGLATRHAPRLLRLAHRLPAFRMYVDMTLAYAYALIVWKTSTQNTFGQDFIHAIYASRTNALVTSDGQFRKIVKLIPRAARCGVMTWNEFMATLRP